MNAYLMGYMGKEASEEWSLSNSIAPEEEGYTFRNADEYLAYTLGMADKQRHENRVVSLGNRPGSFTLLNQPRYNNRESIDNIPGFTPTTTPDPNEGRMFQKGRVVGTYNPFENAQKHYGKKTEDNLRRSEEYRRANPDRFPEYQDAEGNVPPSNFNQDIPVKDWPYAVYTAYHDNPSNNFIGVPYATWGNYHRTSPGNRMPDRDMRYRAITPGSVAFNKASGLPYTEDEFKRLVEAKVQHEGVHGAYMNKVDFVGSEEKHKAMDEVAENAYRQHDWENRKARQPTYVQEPFEAEPPLAAINRLAFDLGLPWPTSPEEAEEILNYLGNLDGVDVPPEAVRALYYWKHGTEETRETMKSRLPGSFGNINNNNRFANYS